MTSHAKHDPEKDLKEDIANPRTQLTADVIAPQHDEPPQGEDVKAPSHPEPPQGEDVKPAGAGADKSEE